MQVDSNDSVYIAKLKEVILNEFNKRIATNVDVDFFALAAFLDPRWKDLRMIKKQDRDRAIERIEEEMNSLEKTSQPTREVEPAPKRRLLDFDESDEEGDEETEAMAAELRRYRNEPALQRDGDPLGWWRTRMEQYPTLVRLARKYLCVPATSTEAERVFSWMGFLLNKRRLSLSGESVLMQLFLKDNLEL